MIRFTYQDFQETFRRSLVELYKEVWKEPPWNEYFWTDEMINEDIDFALKQEDFVGKLALMQDEVVGFVWGYKLPVSKFPFLDGSVGKRVFYTDELAVKKEFRRKGIGTRLTDMLMEIVKNLSYREIVLRTDINGIAYDFYLTLGFEDTEVKDPAYPERTYLKKSIK